MVKRLSMERVSEMNIEQSTLFSPLGPRRVTDKTTDRKNVRMESLLAWDEYANKSIQTALPSMYNHAQLISDAARDWYWKSIKIKKRLSLGVMRLTLFLLIIGTILPILAGLPEQGCSFLLSFDVRSGIPAGENV